MPLFQLACPECGATKEEFCHVVQDRGVQTHVCGCGSTLGYMLSLGIGLTYFEEGKGRWIHNLGDQPVYITSHEQHKREMRKAGVDWATKWPTQKTGGWV